MRLRESSSRSSSTLASSRTGTSSRRAASGSESPSKVSATSGPRVTSTVRSIAVDAWPGHGRGAHHGFVVARRAQARRVPPHALVDGIPVVRHAGTEPERPDRPGMLGRRHAGDRDAPDLPTRAGITGDHERHDLAAAGGIQARADLRPKVTAGAEHVLRGGHRVTRLRGECGAADALANGARDGRRRTAGGRPRRERPRPAAPTSAGRSTATPPRRGLGEEVDGREPLQVDEMLDRRTDL